jgi:lysozyme family protein
METNFKRCMDFVFDREGGYVDNPDDPGGATNLGITIGTLTSWRGKTVTKQDVKNLDKAEATRIYHKRYWLEARCDRLPSGLDLAVYDFAVNAGTGRSLDYLKQEFGIVIPPPQPNHTHRQYPTRMRDPAMQYVLANLPDRNVRDLISGVCSRRRAFYRRSSQFAIFGKGWLDRVDRAQRLAEHMWFMGPDPRSAPTGGPVFAGLSIVGRVEP